MKKIKYFLLIIFLFLICGCSANYNLDVDKDFNIGESLDIIVKKQEFEIHNTDIKSGIDENIFRINNLIKYPIDNYKVNNNFKTVNVNIKKNYKGITEYSNSAILNDLNGKIEIYSEPNSKSNIKVFQIIINYDFFDLINTNKYSNIPLEKINLNIGFPYKVISTNAQKSGKNTYMWNLKKNSKAKSFYIEYDEEVLYKEGVNSVFIILLLLILLIILFIILFERKKKKNKI